MIRVKIYWNLHKYLFSVKSMSMDFKYNEVIGHGTEIVLKDVTYPVSEKGRQRVLASRQKNVHASVLGTLLYLDAIDREGNPLTGPVILPPTSPMRFELPCLPSDHFIAYKKILEATSRDIQKGDGVEITYNPYKNRTFVTVIGNIPVNKSDFLHVVSVESTDKERPNNYPIMRAIGEITC